MFQDKHSSKQVHRLVLPVFAERPGHSLHLIAVEVPQAPPTTTRNATTEYLPESGGAEIRGMNS